MHVYSVTFTHCFLVRTLEFLFSKNPWLHSTWKESTFSLLYGYELLAKDYFEKNTATSPESKFCLEIYLCLLETTSAPTMYSQSFQNYIPGRLIYFTMEDAFALTHIKVSFYGRKTITIMDSISYLPLGHFRGICKHTCTSQGLYPNCP